VKTGSCIAFIKDAFGNLLKKYFSKSDCIIIGKSNNPVAQVFFFIKLRLVKKFVKLVIVWSTSNN
jgi:hypothetical protein